MAAIDIDSISQGLITVSIDTLLEKHPLLLIRCNPLDREWICQQIEVRCERASRWKLHAQIKEDNSSLFQSIVRAVERGFAGGSHIIDNYLAALKTIEPWQQQVIYESIADLALNATKAYRLVWIETNDLPLPLEIARFFVEYNWPFPTTEEIAHTLQEFGIAPTERYLRLSAGLSYQELRLGLERAIAEPNPELSLENYRNARLALMGIKYTPSPEVMEVGGLDLIVEAIEDVKFGFSEAARMVGDRGKGLPYPKGYLLVGVPGTGKSHTAKYIAATLGYPMLWLEIDKVKVGGLSMLARVLEIAQRCSPCVFYMDEIEKLFTAEDKVYLSLLLTWLQENTDPVFVIGTMNRIEDLPIEATRAGRFDDVFEVNSPDQDSRLKLFQLFLKRYDSRFEDSLVFSMEDWKDIVDETMEYVGSEIEQIVNNTALRLARKSEFIGADGAIEILITPQDLIESSRRFMSMFERNRKGILKIQNAIRNRASKSSSTDRSILPKTNIDIFAPVSRR